MDPNPSSLSRRGLLLAAAAGGGALIVTALLAPTTASAKVPQRSVNYRGAPNGKARCLNCALWQPPAACKVVSGLISANGWCSIYAPKKA